MNDTICEHHAAADLCIICNELESARITISLYEDTIKTLKKQLVEEERRTLKVSTGKVCKICSASLVHKN